MFDEKGMAHMFQGSRTTFTRDRFGNSNSSLSLIGSWTQVPGGVYFNTVEFTFSLWIYPQQVSSPNGARIIDFANGP